MTGVWLWTVRDWQGDDHELAGSESLRQPLPDARSSGRRSWVQPVKAYWSPRLDPGEPEYDPEFVARVEWEEPGPLTRVPQRLCGCYG